MTSTTTWIRGLGLAALCAGAVWAHTDATLGTMKAPHGGQMRVAGIYHLELVVSGEGREVAERQLVVYVTDHDGKAVPTAGGTGNATLLAGKLRASVTLVADGANRLKGFAKVPASAELKAVVSVTLPGKSTEQARFTPFEARAGGSSTK